MGNINRTIALILIGIIAISCLSLLTVKPTNAQSSNQAPAIAWQQTYGDFYNGTGVQDVPTDMAQDSQHVEAVSNLVQTSDGGYAFMDDGWGSYGNFKPALVFKVDSSGNINWTKAIVNFLGSAIIQTRDGGYEVSGNWVNSQGTSITPTLVRMDFQGNIESVRNYSSVPNLGVSASNAGRIQTSDGGYVYWTLGTPTALVNALPTGPSSSVVKTSSNNSTQWVRNLTYPDAEAPGVSLPLEIFSVIETKDGALAILGVGDSTLDNPTMGTIYLIKTETFLSPSTNLPTLSIVIASSGAVVIVVLSVVLYSRRRRRTAGLKQ
jgi:hypothetical protein